MKKWPAAIMALAIASGCAGQAVPRTSATPSQPGAASADPAVAASGHDVLTYRGDSARTGTMPGPGPSHDPAIAWQFTTEGPIGSSPVVSNGTVFVVSVPGDVHALDLATGAEKWKVNLGAEAHGTPLVAGGNLVVADSAGVVHALDPLTGTSRWTVATDGDIDGAPASTGTLIVTATQAGTAYALDATTGAVTWQRTLPGGVSRSIALDGQAAYVGVSPGLLVAVRLSDGSIVWQSRLAPQGEIGTPTLGGDIAYAATGLDGDEPSDKGLAAVDVSSGKVRWRYHSPQHAQVYSPALVDGRAIVVGEDSTVVGLDATTGALLWTSKTDAPNEALPAVVGGSVYVPSNGDSLLALDTGDGHTIWQAPIHGIPYAPIVTGGFVVVGTNLGLLFAIADGPR